MTQDLTLDIELAGMEDVIADVDVFPQMVGRELTVAMEASLDFLKGQVKTRTPVNTDKLAGSINHGITSQFPNLVGFVGTPVEYAPVMEYGRKPGTKDADGKYDNFPKVDAIRLWVHQVLKLSGKEADSVAFLVARSIAKKGIKGRHMFKEGLEVSEPQINQLFNNAIARSVARFNQS